MAMSSHDIVHHMACDFSQWIMEYVPEWEHPNEPADAYIDTIVAAFGDSPTRDSVIAAYQSGVAIKAVQTDMNTGWETDLITDDAAANLVRRALLNNFGPDSIT